MADASVEETGPIGGRETSPAEPHAAMDRQQHPLRIYFIVWIWLFVLSFCSYLVDILGFEGALRWALVLMFMMIKAGLIVAVFMHMVWERLTLATVVVLPPVAILIFLAIMAFEGSYTSGIRGLYFAGSE